MIDREDIPQRTVFLDNGKIISVRDKKKVIKKKYERFLKTFTKKIEYLQRLSGKRIPYCAKCGNKDLRILTGSHIGNRKDNVLEVRCINCNWIYEYEKGCLFFNAKVLQNHLRKEGIIEKWDKIEV